MPTHSDDTRYCVFHDIDYLKAANYSRHKDEVASKFKEKLEECSSIEKPFGFVGYCLPEISFDNYEFTQPIVFVEFKFYGTAIFSRAQFKKEVNLSKTTFYKAAYFDTAKFYADFKLSEVTFSEEADFSGAGFSKAVFFDIHFSEISKTSFYGSEFSSDVTFYNTFFKNEILFQRARFLDRAVFTNSTFKQATFGDVTFYKETDFSFSTFEKIVDFSRTKFLDEVRFSEPIELKIFNEGAFFNYAIFGQPSKAVFDVKDLSNVSFAGSDISKVKFTDRVRWGGRDGLKIIEEEWLENFAGNQPQKWNRPISLDQVLYVYRRLRENYELNLKFDEAGKYFIKEMELKRNYRTIHFKNNDVIRKNNWFRRRFSLTAFYSLVSTYGESIAKPIVVGVIIIMLSTSFWILQNNPLDEAFIPYITDSQKVSNFITNAQILNSTHTLKALERSVADFLPLLPLPAAIKVGLIDYTVKIIGGALTFGLLVIALRRKFERKYTR
jgi:uncharacterized protein YjbI with pentapeptide repeats